MRGYSVEELIGRSVEGTFAPESRQGLKEHVSIVNDVGRHAFESVHVRKDGSLFPVYVDATSVKGSDEQVQYHLSIIQDLTEKKRLEISEKERMELERSNSDLDRLASILSHDLQAPANTVSMYTQLLVRKLSDKLSIEDQQLARHLIGGAHRMGDIIKALLAFSRVGGESNQETREDDLETTLKNTLEDLKASIDQTKADIVFENLPNVIGNSALIGQLFQNLIATALKFQRERIPVIRIGAIREGEYWRVSVCDNGIGFEPEFANQIFDLFRRLHSRDKYPGKGLGLATCKRIVQYHGGKIWAESKPNEGAIFYFTLPATTPVQKGDLKGYMIPGFSLTSQWVVPK